MKNIYPPTTNLSQSSNELCYTCDDEKTHLAVVPKRVFFLPEPIDRCSQVTPPMRCSSRLSVLPCNVAGMTGLHSCHFIYFIFSPLQILFNKALSVTVTLHCLSLRNYALLLSLCIGRYLLASACAQNCQQSPRIGSPRY